VCDRRGAPRQGNKGDQVDADQLSELLRRGALRAVYHGSADRATLKELTRTYRNSRKSGRTSVNLADRLRELAERLPSGASLTLTREGLLGLATKHDDPDQPLGRPDFTIAELAVRFYRSPSTVRGWCERGRFEGAYKLNGRDWRIPQAGVDAFVAGQRSEHAVTRLGAWRAVQRADLARR